MVSLHWQTINYKNSGGKKTQTEHNKRIKIRTTLITDCLIQKTLISKNILRNVLELKHNMEYAKT